PCENELHELIFDFPGWNSVSITPQDDGTALTPFNMTWSRATTQENQLTLTDITSGVTYVTEFASFTMYVCRDNGTVTISDEDTSGYVYFSEQHTGGRVVLPDAAISAGNTIDIVNSGAPVMVKPAKNNVLLKVPGNSDALPSAFMLTGSGQLVQSG
ncbi:sialate O-acetylesterase, partial [Cronobacter turicensis]|nr:sialate O-acetylesterase [Cronobacter turicensis]